jgi:hypothetical protein
MEYPVQSQCPVCRAEESAKNLRLMREHQEEMQKQQEDDRENAKRQQEQARWEHEAEAERLQWDREREQADAEARHRELLAKRDEEIERQKHPGEYFCPKCKFRTLMPDAEVCFRCGATISRVTWAALYEEAQRAREEWARRAKAAAEEQAKLNLERRRQAEAEAARVAERTRRSVQEQKETLATQERRETQTYVLRTLVTIVTLPAASAGGIWGGFTIAAGLGGPLLGFFGALGGFFVGFWGGILIGFFIADGIIVAVTGNTKRQRGARR